MKMQKRAIFVKKSLKISIFQIKNIIKFEIIVIIHANVEVLHIVYAIQSIVHLKKFLYFFIMDLTIIIILQ